MLELTILPLFLFFGFIAVIACKSRASRKELTRNFALLQTALLWLCLVASDISTFGVDLTLDVSYLLLGVASMAIVYFVTTIYKENFNITNTEKEHRPIEYFSRQRLSGKPGSEA